MTEEFSDKRSKEETRANLRGIESETMKEKENPHTIGLFHEDTPSESATFTSKMEAIMFINALMDAFKIESEELEW